MWASPPSTDTLRRAFELTDMRRAGFRTPTAALAHPLLGRVLMAAAKGITYRTASPPAPQETPR